MPRVLDYELLTDFRTEIMGLAILGVVIYHAPVAIPRYPVFIPVTVFPRVLKPLGGSE